MAKKDIPSLNIEFDDYTDILIAALRKALNSDDKKATKVATYIHSNLKNLSTRFCIIAARDIVEVNAAFDTNFNKDLWHSIVLKPVLEKLESIGYTYTIEKTGYGDDCHLVLQRPDENTNEGYDNNNEFVNVKINSKSEMVFLHAVNYALGRDTSMPHTVVSSLIPGIPIFSSRFIKKCFTLLKDYESLGYDDSVYTWCRFYGELAKEQTIRKICKKYIGSMNKILEKLSA